MFTFINSKVIQGIGQLVLYKHEPTGQYVVSVFQNDSKTSVDAYFEFRSEAARFREMIRKV